MTMRTRPPGVPGTTDRTHKQTTDTSAVGDAAGDSGGDADMRIRILSYNVLGPKHALTPKHGYCPLTVSIVFCAIYARCTVYRRKCWLQSSSVNVVNDSIARSVRYR